MRDIDDAIAIIEHARASIAAGPIQPWRFLNHAVDYLQSERDYLFEEKWKQIRGA